MSQYIQQAEHNQEFHDCIDCNFKGRYYDWQITVLFYVAVHYLKALAEKRGVDIGESHKAIRQNVCPASVHRIMQIPNNAWRWYSGLLEYSRSARYNGIADFEHYQELKQNDHAHAVILLESFKSYVCRQLDK